MIRNIEIRKKKQKEEEKKRETAERKGKETQKSVNMSILLQNVFEQNCP